MKQHPEIAWIEIHPNGDETPMHGHIWANGPTIAGCTTYWCIPDESQAAVLVIRVSRRIRAGRERPDGRYGPQDGRWLAKGTLFAERDARGAFNVAARRTARRLETRTSAVSDHRPVSEWWPSLATYAREADDGPTES
jgi:hypothetical protein